MIILDLFDTHHEKALKEGAVGADESMGYGGLAGEELDEYIQRRRDTNYSEFPAGTHVTHAMMGDHVGKVVDAKNIPIEDRRDSGVPVQFGNRIYWMSPSGLKMFGNSSMLENSEELVGFHLDTELAYQAVIRKFGNVVSQDPESGTMYVPASVWTQVEQVAFDADGRGAEREEGVAEGLNEFAQGDFNGGDDSNDLQLYLNVAKKLNMKKYKPSTAHDLIAKKMAELVDAVDDEKVDWARHMARKAQGLPSMLDQQGVAENSLNELSKNTLKSYSRERGTTIHQDQRDADRARDTAADKKKHGNTKAAADWNDEASWLDKRAEKGAKGVAQAAIKIAKKGMAEGGPYDLPGKDYDRPGDMPRKQSSGEHNPYPYSPEEDDDYFREIFRKKREADKAKAQGGSLNELSTQKLAQYKTAAAVDAKKADAAGNYARGDRRFKGINQATIKQFANDLKKHGQQGVAEGSSTASDAVERAILNRIMVAHTDLLRQFGPDKVMQAAEEVAYNAGDVDEIGTSDVSAYVRQVQQILGAE